MTKAKVVNGIDQLDVMDKYLRGRRIGIVSGGASIDRNNRLTVDILCERYNVTALFNTVAGIRGEFIYGERVPSYTDSVTGLTVDSIFCRERIAPTLDMLDRVDVMVFDIRDAGARFFEYLHCCAAVMKACAAAGKPLIIPDRIAPIDGITVEGTVCPPEMHTIVGDYELATRTAMTMGEFTEYVNGEYNIGCDLTVIKAQGWKRSMYFDDTDLTWVLPSFSLPHVTANLLYPGMCVFEGVASVSEGRGTSKPFELIGAPWLDAYELAKRLGRLDLNGVTFVPTYFKPLNSKHAGQVCSGVQTVITDRTTFESFRTGIMLLDEIRSMYPEKIVWEDCSAGHDVLELPSQPHFDRYLDKLLATKEYTNGARNGSQLIDDFALDRKKYIARKEKYHLYE